MKQDGPEISCDAWELKGFCFLLKLLNLGIFLGLAQFPEFFCTIFLVKKEAPKLIAIIKK